VEEGRKIVLVLRLALAVVAEAQTGQTIQQAGREILHLLVHHKAIVVVIHQVLMVEVEVERELLVELEGQVRL
jgi:hypothetical protein